MYLVLTDSRPSADVKRFGHCRLTHSPARTNVVLFLHRTVRLIILRVADRWALPVERCVLARQGWAGENGSLFEHPADIQGFAPYGTFPPYCWH
ncbi:MAG: hypothetical protein OJF51_000300 [Nitrospira sp.]|nr:MAG: hypothetical protein OJF51_000300 [Nitrospira sp.]